MLGLLSKRGEAAYLRFPGRVSVEPDPPSSPLPLRNCRLLESQVYLSQDRFYVFNFRVSYVSDEKRETFITVSLDAEGQPAPQIQPMLAKLEANLLSPNGSLDLEPDRLPQMLELAGEVARQQAESQSIGLEEAIRSRLEKVLLRLSSYYRRLMNEVNTGDSTRDETVRVELQQELGQKIADELERHRLRVTLTPLSYAVAVTPFAHYRLALATTHSRQNLHLARNLHTGQLEPYTCHHCGEPLDHIALCDRGHGVHGRCLETCQQCGRAVCQACGIQNCAICSRSVCIDCVNGEQVVSNSGVEALAGRATCAYCQRWLCNQHLAACAICGLTYCTQHSFYCKCCHQTYCSQCGSGAECKTCRRVLTASVIKVADIPAIAGLSPERYEWRRAKNKAFSVYIGRWTAPGFISFWLRRWQVVIVVDKAGEIVYWRKKGIVEQMFRS
jgi:hypothetical protein